MKSPNQSLDVMATSYLAALMSGDYAAALHLIRQAQGAGVSLCTIYQSVLQPVLYEIGQLWERGELDIANEHLATAMTRRVMEICFNDVNPILTGPPKVLASCIGPESHDIGLRMIADCLELRGWRTLYLGANTPPDAIAALAVRHHVSVVAISITISQYVRYVRDLIAVLRRSPEGAAIKLLVGGQPFQRIPNLWRQVGADGTAADVLSAIDWIEQHLEA
ncbi:MAG: hypothetical protein HC822_08230 [Oscillochloris sp.]|nr:hypothetical protein [Oscillochloris sp.]